MNNSTPLFPNFHLQTLRRKPRSAQQILAAQLAQLKRKTFSQLGECLGKFIPTEYLRPTASGPLSRRRVFSKENTFWAFFSQVLGADGGCQEVVRQLQAFAALKATVLPSSSTAAYCQARKKLTLPSRSHSALHRDLAAGPTNQRSIERTKGGRGRWDRREHAGHRCQSSRVAPTALSAAGLWIPPCGSLCLFLSGAVE